MNNAAKILIIVNLLFAVGLAALTMNYYAVNENWKRRWDQDTREMKKELDGANQDKANFSMKAVRAESALADRDRAIADQQALVKTKEDELTRAQQREQNINTDLQKSKTDYAALNENYMAQSKSLELVRSRNAELTHIAQVARGVAFNLNVKLAEIEDDLNNAQGELTQRTQRIDELTKENTRSKAVLALLQQRNPQLYNELVDQKASTHLLQGVVAAVRDAADGEQDLVMLSIGRDDKVEPGIEFIVYRGSDYLARVRAERVMADTVSCRVIRDSLNTKSLKIQQGDLATNRL